MFMERQLKPEYKAPPPVISWSDENETIDTLARTIWGEARGESLSGQEAVANVILNRVRVAKAQGHFWWGNDITSVCRKPYQFSCWNKNDLNFMKAMRVTTEDRIFTQCLRLARRAVHGTLADNTHGATHYHTDAVRPPWARNQSPTALFGQHIFYRIVE